MKKLAAIDLGSNSFHLLDAEFVDGTLSFGQRIKNKVQIGAGLDIDHNLTQTSINRGLDSLLHFQRHIKEQNISGVVAVGTNTLRIANNRDDFIQTAEEMLSTSIRIISGEEEAGLIFNGVIHEIDKSTSGLVLDVGGGSTEFAIGDTTGTTYTQSLQMGCVSYYQRFFADGKVYYENVRAAEKAARLEIEPHLINLSSGVHNWIAGTSGTIQSIAMLAQQFCNESQNILKRSSIESLEKRLIFSGHVKNINSELLDRNRCEILPAGLAIVKAIFDTLELDQIQVCQAALCEGLLLDLCGL